MNLIQKVEEQFLQEQEVSFRPGDTVLCTKRLWKAIRREFRCFRAW